MTALALAAGDSATMLRRNLRHALRYPSMTLSTIGMPVVVLLLFTYAFGGALGAGIGTTAAGGGYVDYVVPGVLLMAAMSGAVAHAGHRGVLGHDRGDHGALSHDGDLTLVGADRARHRQHAPDAGEHRGGRRHRDRDRVQARGRPCRVVRSGRAAGPPDVRPDLVLRGSWPHGEDGREREQRTFAAAVPAVPRLRRRADGLDARRPAGVRRAPAVHPDHRDAARAPARDPRRRGGVVAVAWCAGIALAGFLWARWGSAANSNSRLRRRYHMAERRLHGLQRVLGVNALFSTAYGNVGSSIYYALGLVASYALVSPRSSSSSPGCSSSAPPRRTPRRPRCSRRRAARRASRAGRSTSSSRSSRPGRRCSTTR